MVEVEVDPQQSFEDFLKQAEYRKKISQMVVANSNIFLVLL